MLNSFFNIEYQNETHSYRWLWAAISIVQAIIFYYATTNKEILSPIYIANIGIYLLSSLYFGYQLWNHKQTINTNYLHGGITLSALNWLLMSALVYQLWGAESASEKILLLGFFSTLICFSANTFLLVMSTLPIIIADSYIKIFIRDIEGLDLLVSIGKYPLLLLAMIYTTLHFNRELRHSHKKISALNKELVTLKNTDPLTGLNNRRVFDDRLAYAIDMHIRLEQPVSLMILDIDFFKNYNDALGHPAGDKCLVEISALLKARLQRNSDVLARIGGEEFAVILPGTNIDQSKELATILIAAINKGAIPHPNSTAADTVTLSIGIACMDASDNDDAKSLYKSADSALYRAKQAGRNQFSSYDALREAVKKKTMLV